MVIELKEIVENYKNDDDLVAELETDLDNLLDFDRYGRYEFVRCGNCGGPRLGHRQEKCRQLKEKYNQDLVKAFESKIKTIDDFRRTVKRYMEREEEKESKRKAKEIEAAVGAVLEKFERKDIANQTSQLIKARFPPIWSGQKFEHFRGEVEKWKANNKASEEDKFIDLLESLKKNDSIKEYVHRTLIEKVGNDRTVKRILDVLSDKYSMTTAEKILGLMKKISDFKAEEDVETLLDRFEEIITETDKVDLATNLHYALSIQFMERLEKSNKINTGEKL